MTLAGVAVDLDRLLVAFAIDEARERIDLVVHHPAFAALAERAWHVTYDALDTAIGSEGVERWIGTIELANDEPDEAKPLAYLIEAVGVLAVTATYEQFALLRGEGDDGRPRFATVNLALKRIDHPTCTAHLTITIPLAAPDDAGLPSDDEAAALDALEDAILLPDAIFVGRETGAGVRVLHFVAPPGIDVTGIAPDGAQVDVVDDPAWDFLRRFD
ncbi:MAG: DUF695 domain-containing protein [Proteobacteria bacterium]|nr:DUF695 domain-containing protein [Pseudomonadota bacterium]